jgi:hypothetical protein
VRKETSDSIKVTVPDDALVPFKTIREIGKKNRFAACCDRPAIHRWATKLHRINPVLRCESPIDRALYRSPQIYQRSLSTEQGDVFNWVSSILFSFGTAQLGRCAACR